jgi:ferredoxin-type protein NapG
MSDGGGPDASRRAFFKNLIGRGARTAAEEVSRRLPTIPNRRRPPGAVPDEVTFLARCTACGDCVTACEPKAIFTLRADVTPGGKTPVMVPDERACEMCAGFPCAEACETGALNLPALATEVRLGTVRVAEDRCFVFKGPECGACAGLCPDGVDALKLTLGRPSVDEERCTGCGLCIAACPVRPAAIDLLPLGEGERGTS